MPDNVNTAPSLPNGSHGYATDASGRRGLSSSPLPSPSQQVPSLVDVDQLKQECHSTRFEVTEHELLPHHHVELVHIVSWMKSEDSDHPTVFSFSSTSRESARADLGSSSNVDPVSVKTRHAQYILSDDQSLVEKGHSRDVSTTRDSPRDHFESINVMPLDVDRTFSPPTLVSVDPRDIFPELLYSTDPSELILLSISYPTAIIEDALSLYDHETHTE